MKTYNLKVKFVFTGTLDVRADSKKEALEIANRSFGMVAGEISKNELSEHEDEEGISDWDISTHPDEKIIK